MKKVIVNLFKLIEVLVVIFGIFLFDVINFLYVDRGGFILRRKLLIMLLVKGLIIEYLLLFVVGEGFVW